MDLTDPAQREEWRLLAAGEWIGPLNAGLMRLLDEELGAGFGPVEPAPDVRGSHD